jgi:(p)ppGpp synthase/HD superfamily hydrolase
MNNLEKALMIAEKAHNNQSYDSIYPYMYHIKEVVRIAQELEFNKDIQVACALHVVLEDSDVSYNDLKKSFNKEIAEIVYAVTDELGRNRKERKEKTYPKIKANWKAIAVKLCDRIANIEHSIASNSRFKDLYVKEHIEFKENLLTFETVENTKLGWAYLDNLIKNL